MTNLSTETMTRTLSDSGIYQEGEGWERVMIVSHWNPETPRQMSMIHLRVDRIPGRSFLTTSVWAPQTGWQRIADRDHREFWEHMPGYLRWSNDFSEQASRGLMDEAIQSLVVLAQAGHVPG